MRLHFETSLWHPGAALDVAVSPRGIGRAGLGLPVLAFMGDGNHVSVLARGAMR
jgi:hypothetical protein